MMRITTLLLVALAGCHASTQPEATTMEAKDPTTAPKTTTAAGSMVFGLGPGFELAPQATYSVTQKAGEVTIKATGESPTPGYEVKLVQSPLRIWPPQWYLARKRPEGTVLQVITPFEVTASFKSDDSIKSVRVSDAAGRHDINVEQAAP